jgi:hypothetical protein
MAERASAKHSAQAPEIARSASCGALVSRLLSRFGDAEAENFGAAPTGVEPATSPAVRSVCETKTLHRNQSARSIEQRRSSTCAHSKANRKGWKPS